MYRLFLSSGLCLAAISPALSDPGTSLTPPQREIISRNIDLLPSQEERKLASEWNNAKKVAEFICRPAAIAALQKWDQQADRVFLGTDDPKTLTLENDRLLKGSGQVRAGNDWTTFAFSCELDPNSGRALTFETDLAPRT
ncbi:hypothetical protein [Limoniibacter endophyticus]|uniref:DUF930 domain-containing protein n=1 Tax=Limoniibacter endophyticus TaxID=1565040 RepID=A0A8J3DLR1_9HYPH|nr:hypothetical protein [Limoniibacter endophyticus]GHC68597.1 hypothetical protein GCM10010136_13460 [Limoniibacter endophyticus]